jgi:putative transcriptional regulator
MQSLKGQLLLDGGKLAGSPFHRTVVLICRHDYRGAFGLVLNRPTGHTVGEAIGESVPDAVSQLPIFLGGPVQPQALSCLRLNPANEFTEEENVLPGLFLAHTLDGAMHDASNVKFFAGYAGWSPGQLDNEMKQDAWLTHPATMNHVFHARPLELWREILLTKGTKYRLLAEFPENPSNN